MVFGPDTDETIPQEIQEELSKTAKAPGKKMSEEIRQTEASKIPGQNILEETPGTPAHRYKQQRKTEEELNKPASEYVKGLEENEPAKAA